ncbi:MAG TPA: TrkH family potassium uptake protein [bacterium]|nr:TrkH family potassium uptake protein [bacterium]HPN44199.1 TrkH family potassium uptake protein [bacterium]
MNYRVILHILGALLLFEGLSLLLPLPFSYYYGDGDAQAIITSALICLGCGAALFLPTGSKKDLGIREGFVIVALGWTLLAAFGAIPFVIGGAIPSYTDAFFETMSGFTTTGASILPNVETVPHGLLFWRSLTHWLGGMGIIVLSLAILPILGVGGMQLYKAEVPGPSPDKLSPRIRDTAKILWVVYFLMSALQTGLLMLGGMTLFDSLCHTFGSMATGGFSTKNTSVGYYNSLYIEIVIIFFMFMAGVNFSLHYAFLKGNFKSYWKDREFLFYIKFTTLSILFVTIVVYFSNYHNAGQSLRAAAFQVVSILTTTGFVTADFEKWAHAGQIALLVLMFVGGCAGSTGGAIKVIRFMIVLKQGVLELRKLLHPNAYIPMRLGGRVIQPEVVTEVLGFFIIYMLIFIIGSIIMTCFGLDLVTAGSSVAATLGNIGPGLAVAGPMDNYAFVPAGGKWALSFFMLLGRLELYTILILFVPEFWKK